MYSRAAIITMLPGIFHIFYYFYLLQSDSRVDRRSISKERVLFKLVVFISNAVSSYFLV